MFYILKCFDPPDGFLARIEYQDDDPFRFWNTGERFEEAPALPLQARLIGDKQTVPAEMWETPLPIMSQRLHDALVACGVSNLDTYPVVLTDARTGKVLAGYLAFNLIGVIAAAVGF